jgi:hypothetical protein
VNSGKQIDARGDLNRLLHGWKSCIFATRNNNSWTGGMFVDCTDVTYASCGKHLRTSYWLYHYKLVYNGTLLLQFLSLVSYMQLIIRPFFISSDRVIYIYIYIVYFYIINHFYKILLLRLCILDSCNLFTTYIQKLMFLLQDQQ